MAEFVHTTPLLSYTLCRVIDTREGGIGNGSACGCASALGLHSRPLGLDAHAPARGYFAMAVRAAAVAFQEEKEGLETSMSESLV